MIKSIHTSRPQGHRTSIVLLILMLMLGSLTFAQTKKLVSGTVKDGTGAGLPGATVAEQGGGNSTLTDGEGRFVIETQVGKTLSISFIGFVTENVAVTADTSEINTVLQEDATTLKEVEIVSVGYGTQKRSDLTGAISSVSEKNLNKGNLTSTELVLQGKVAGLSLVRGSGDPAAGASLRLRGGTSLSASNNPLIVVDGIPGVDINSVQPSDIKTIDVLKDASATAIYGSRGANGVIIITTKGTSKGFSVQYSGITGVGFAQNHVDLLSANQWRQYVRENNVQDAIDYGGNTDWQKELEQTAFSHNHTLSINSGKEFGGVRASINYFNNEGLIKTTGMERVATNLSMYQYALEKRLKFDVGLFANIDKWHPLDYRIFERAFNLNPTIPVYNPDGSFTQVGGTLYENPVELMTNRDSDNTRHRLLGYFKTEIELFDGLKANGNFSLEHNATKTGIYKPSYAMLEGMTEKGYGQHRPCGSGHRPFQQLSAPDYSFFRVEHYA